MVRSRGYVSRVHTILAAHDLNALKAYDPIPASVYVEKRGLDQVTMELCLVVGMTCLRGAPYALQSHMRKAVHFGAAPLAVLEALELVIPEAGRVVVGRAGEAWRRLYPEEPEMPDAAEPSDLAAATPVTGEALWHPRVRRAVTGLLEEVYVRDRQIDGMTKEYLLITALTCLRAEPERLSQLMRRALEAGGTAEAILEVLELTIPHGGLLTFEHGLAVWSEVTGAAELQANGAVFTKLG